MQGCAADTMCAIASKRMDALPKLELLQQLGIAPAVAACEATLRRVSAESKGHDDDATEAASRLSGLVNALALEAIDSVKRLENQAISMQVCSCRIAEYC